jgi:hypothetical protein
MLLHEANNPMLLQGIVKSPDIPAVNDYSIVREGETLPLRPRYFWLQVLTPHCTDTSKRGAFIDLPAISTSPVLVTKEFVLGGDKLWASPARGYTTNGAVREGEEPRTSPAQGVATNVSVLGEF